MAQQDASASPLRGARSALHGLNVTAADDGALAIDASGLIEARRLAALTTDGGMICRRASMSQASTAGGGTIRWYLQHGGTTA